MSHRGPERFRSQSDVEDLRTSLLLLQHHIDARDIIRLLGRNAGVRRQDAALSDVLEDLVA